MARVPLRTQSDLPDDYQYLLGTDSLGEPNILCAMANNPPLLQMYMRYGTALWKESGLSERERELVILAAARKLDSRYEWQQHVRLGRQAGITDDEIIAIGTDDLAVFPDDERVLLEYARAFMTREVTDELSDELTGHYNASTVLGAALLSSHYVATAYTLDALDIPLESEFVGWRLETPMDSGDPNS